jgi:hypothetical protein
MNGHFAEALYPVTILFDMIKRERRLQMEDPFACMDSVDREQRYLCLLDMHMYERRN